MDTSRPLPSTLSLQRYTLTVPAGQPDPVIDSYVMPVRPAAPVHLIATRRKVAL